MTKPLIVKSDIWLMSELREQNERLRHENEDLRSRFRIAEAGRPKVAYLCDGRACGDDCGLVDCIRTTQIEHAKNFAKEPTGYYYEVEPTLEVMGIAEIAEKIIEAVKQSEGK